MNPGGCTGSLVWNDLRFEEKEANQNLEGRHQDDPCEKEEVGVESRKELDRIGVTRD
jgi:hypothetical protein